jgi:hypothetical protein
MRDYDDYGEYVDDSIRLHTPVLQRVLILAAVIIAVPVVMWTITAFVRSYVARPKAPVLQQVASTESPAAARLGSQVPATAAPAANQPAPNLPAPPPRTDTPVRAPSADASPAAPPVTGKIPQPPGVQSTSSQSAPSPAPAGRPGTAGIDTTASSPAPTGPIATAPTVPAAGPALRTADNAPTAAARGDRDLAWPNPNSTSPPSFGSAVAPAAPAAPAALPRTAAIETLPRSEPIRGPIPLPRHRPAGAAMASSGPASGASGGPVPLPRGRPSGAPAEASSPLTNPGGYEPGLSAGGG